MHPARFGIECGLFTRHCLRLGPLRFDASANDPREQFDSMRQRSHAIGRRVLLCLDEIRRDCFSARGQIRHVVTLGIGRLQLRELLGDRAQHRIESLMRRRSRGERRTRREADREQRDGNEA